MEIRLLNQNYDKDIVYYDFAKGSISLNAEYVSDESIYIKETPDFPIYIAKSHNSYSDFKLAILTLKDFYINTSRDIHLNKRFWQSLFCLYKRDYIVSKYPEVLDNQKDFFNIVLKKFDWENYVYKCVLAAEYIVDMEFETELEEENFIRIIYENLDLYNYLIKYNIFRNGEFIVKFLSVVDEENLGDIMKKQIKNRPDLGKDERYGRRVIFELNKKYPIIMSPFLDKKELKTEILSALSLYLDFNTF